MSQKFSHTEETLVKGAIHSQKSRCLVKNGNGCTGVKSSFHRKNPLRPGKILTVVRNLILKLGAFKPDRSYHTKVNYRNKYGQGAWDKQYPKHGLCFLLLWEFTSLSMCRMMADERGFLGGEKYTRRPFGSLRTRWAK
jgi:hypothetical protein